MPALPGWEAGCGPADPALSASFSSYTGSGYGTRGGTGAVGTINTGTPASVTPGPQPAQVRSFVGSDGNLYGLDNRTGLTWKTTTAGGPVQPGNYTPTRNV